MNGCHKLTTGQQIIKYTVLTFAILIIAAIMSGMAAVGEMIFDSGELTESKRYEITDEVTSLDVEINGARFTVEYADAFAVESNIKALKVTSKGGVLIIEEKSKLFKTDGNAALTLFIPESFGFNSVDIDTGAGEFVISELTAESLSLSLGAGRCEIGKLTVSKAAEIEGGAGELTVKDGKIGSLDLEVGAGDIYLRSEITKKADLELGVGTSRILLPGGEEKYRLDVSRGIGEVKLDGKPFGGGSFGDGDVLVDVDCGIGEVDVRFE